MKRSTFLSILLTLVMLLGMVSLTACGNTESDSQTDTSVNEDAGTVPSEAPAKSYTYKVRAMQGVESCVYYTAGTEIPNSNGGVASGKNIYVWTKCTTCGDDGYKYSHTISVDELNFSNGDTTQYVGSDSCWDCQWEKGLDSFMWAVEITRVEVE